MELACLNLTAAAASFRHAFSFKFHPLDWAFPESYGYFGFKGAQVEPRAKSTKSLPWWFWAGGIVMGFFWWLMWTRVTPFGNLVHWAFTPLWWGFIFFLDGIVYQRNNGASLFSKKPLTL